LKLLLKTIAVLLLLYCLCWAGLAAYFGFAERHKGLLEDNLGSVFVFTFWPRFTDFAVEKPSLEIATLPNNKLQIAGIALSGNSKPGFNRERVLSWLLDQSNAAWHDGEIRWRKSDGSVQRYTDISFVYQRQQQTREARGTITSPKGKVSALIQAEGNPLSTKDWDASIEVMSGADQQLLEPGDLSFKVEDGMGQFRLARLDVERIKDVLSLSGLADKARWILDAELSGLLHDVDFTFTGAVMDLSDWSLTASATDVDFKSLNSLPALNNLNGELNASAKKGSFNFTTANSTFEWSKLYDKRFPINSAQGRITWRRNNDGAFEVSLHQGQLTDPNLSIYDINADLVFDQANRKVSSFGDLFKVDSVEELSYQDGSVVSGAGQLGPKPLSLDASAKFNVTDMSALSAYLPKVKKLNLFRNWLDKAYKSGRMFDGRASYQGELSPKALQNGKAKLMVRSEFDSVTIDYAPEQDWPPATRGRGVAELNNDFLTISPKELWLNGDEVRDGVLTIENLFSREILLKLNGKTSTSLQKGMAFLTDINTVVAFTERTVTADNVRATFLGGETKAKLITTAETQPPKMRLIGSGVANLEQLSPWLGEHLLTWFSGQAAWQGRLDIDGANLVIDGTSDLVGVEVSAPQPLSKAAELPTDFRLSMNLGGKRVDGNEPLQHLSVEYSDLLHAEFKAKPVRVTSAAQASQQVPLGSLFDTALIRVGTTVADKLNNQGLISTQPELPSGINFLIEHPELDIDQLLESVIELAQFQPSVASENTDFLDALRSVKISTPAAISMSRPFGAFEAVATSDDGVTWDGTLTGDNIAGRLSMLPRSDIGSYTLELDKLIVGPPSDNRPPVLPIDKSLSPADYPAIKLTVDSLNMAGRQLGALDFFGQPSGDKWMIEKFALVHNGIRTSATGQWVNQQESGSLSAFDYSTTIEEAEGALDDMDFGGYIRKGRGSMVGKLEWPGAPHEFEYSRLIVEL